MCDYLLPKLKVLPFDQRCMQLYKTLRLGQELLGRQTPHQQQRCLQPEQQSYKTEKITSCMKRQGTEGRSRFAPIV